MIPLLMLLQAAGPAAPVAIPKPDCVALAQRDPVQGQIRASAWLIEGGGFSARHCLGIAHAAAGEWPAAAQAFTDAARGAEKAKDVRAATYWAQAGNAWLAGGDAAAARTALDAALVDPALTGMERGEAELDRARALVAMGEQPAARTSLDRALELAASDPLAWLLSATLARRMGDVPRAQKDIAEALRLSADDASVQLEAGNIAAMAGDAQGAKLAWTAAARIGAGKPIEQQAKTALEQFAP